MVCMDSLTAVYGCINYTNKSTRVHVTRVYHSPGEYNSYCYYLYKLVTRSEVYSGTFRDCAYSYTFKLVAYLGCTSGTHAPFR